MGLRLSAAAHLSPLRVLRVLRVRVGHSTFAPKSVKGYLIVLNSEIRHRFKQDFKFRPSGCQIAQQQETEWKDRQREYA